MRAASGVKHPTGSLIVVIFLSALIGAAIWSFAASLVEKDSNNGKNADHESPDHEKFAVQAKVYFPRNSPEVSIQWDAPEPFVKLTTEIINGSSFDLVATSIDGRLKWDGTEFHRAVELTGDMRIIRDGMSASVLIRQPISASEAAIWKRSKSVVFTSESLVLHLGYTDKYGKKQNFTKQIPWEGSHSWHF